MVYGGDTVVSVKLIFFVSAHSRHVRLVYVFLLFRHKVQYNVQLVFAIEWKKHNKTLQNVYFIFMLSF